MAILTSVLEALAPYIVDMVVDIMFAEKDPEKDSGYKKHDFVMGRLADRMKHDTKMAQFETRDIMDAANAQIKGVVTKLNDKGIFKKGDLCQRIR